ncbi:hypothetical protein [Geodermatophilus sp. URMC 62]|uniref:hypothetical protein n=1 Tax=Geodermatophilus sp. URMC 62 TaxID=3423414 RepID=UPI00406CA4BF
MAALRNTAINIIWFLALLTSPPPTQTSATDPPTSSPQPDRREKQQGKRGIHDFARALV